MLNSLSEMIRGFNQVHGTSKVLVYDFAADQYSHHLDEVLSANTKLNLLT